MVRTEISLFKNQPDELGKLTTFLGKEVKSYKRRKRWRS